MLETIRGYKAIVIAIVIAVTILLIGFALSRDDDTGTTLAVEVTTTVAATATTSGATEPDSEVPPVDCASLLTNEEREVALAIVGRPADQRDSLLSSGSEVCAETLVADEEYFVRIEPGNPDDFEEGAILNDAIGEPVEIADGGLWFGGEVAGLLSVRHETPLGGLHFRIVLGRPDLDDRARRQLALDLASKALPRFPGIEVEPEVTAFPDTSPDRSMVSFVDNLLAKVEDGEWTLGEGLVATLRLFAGEVEAGEVLRHNDLIEYESTGIKEMARDYLEDGPDLEARAEIERLLDLLVFTSDELEMMAGIGPATVALPGTQGIGSAQGAEEDCTLLFGEALGVSKCLEVESFEINGKEFRVFRPAPSLPQNGWTEEKFNLAVRAIRESVPKLDAVGTTPEANLVFSVSGQEYAEASYVAGEPCGIFLYTKVQPFSDGDFKQVIAHELGHCLNGETFSAQKDVDYESRKWWEEGLADFWSKFVYPPNNLEWRTLDLLTQVELATTLFDRAYSNAIFFQYLESLIDIDGIKAVISNLPGSGGLADQAQRMASFSGMDELYHDFARAMADTQVVDTSGALVPYKPIGWDLPLSGPTQVPFTVPAFGVRRLHVIVPPGMYGCYETITQGDQLVSWREGAPGQSGSWDEFGPTELQGETTLVVTTVEEGAHFTLDVLDIDDDPDCSDDDDEEECDLNLVCRASRYFFQVVVGD
ncbi:MAG TPA: hypothetical protein VJA46_02520 [Acidimicrobiia bacterium]|nr:hypothetical protein [Acidimicrobiia bacterium]